jgi:hypothetical protein
MADTTPPAAPEVPEPAAATPAPAAVPPASPYAQQPYATGPKTNTLAIVSLVLSIIGISIAGVITGHIALKQIRERGEGGHGLALAGAIIGWVGCGLWIISWIFVIISVVIFGGSLWTLGSMDYYNY